MKKKIITELIKIAKTLLSIEFPSKEALNDYLHEHPNADPRNHSIKPVHNNPKEVKKTQQNENGNNKIYKSKSSNEIESSISQKAVEVMQKKIDRQADDSVISQFMEACGHSFDDYKKVQELYYSHNVSSGGEHDEAIVNAWHKGDKTSQVMRDFSKWNEWQVLKSQEMGLVPKKNLDYDGIINALKSGKRSKDFTAGGEVSPTVERLITLLENQRDGKQIFYRKGPLDKPVISTTTDERGATSGSRFKPDRFFTFDEMHAMGYRLLSGARGKISNVASQEQEYVWIKDSK